MSIKRGRSTNHQKMCLMRNRMYSLFSLILSATVLASAVAELFRPFSGQCAPLRDTLFSLFLIAVMILGAVRFACSYDRAWLGVVLGGASLGVFKGAFPGLVAPVITVIRIVVVILWLAATIISIWFTRSAFHSAARGPTNSAQRSG